MAIQLHKRETFLALKLSLKLSYVLDSCETAEGGG